MIFNEKIIDVTEHKQALLIDGKCGLVSRKGDKIRFGQISIDLVTIKQQVVDTADWDLIFAPNAEVVASIIDDKGFSELKLSINIPKSLRAIGNIEIRRTYLFKTKTCD